MVLNGEQLYMIKDQGSTKNNLWFLFNLIIIVITIHLHQSWYFWYDQWSTINNESGLAMEKCVFVFLSVSICHYFIPICYSLTFTIIIHLQSSTSIKWRLTVVWSAESVQLRVCLVAGTRHSALSYLGTIWGPQHHPTVAISHWETNGVGWFRDIPISRSAVFFRHSAAGFGSL